MPERKLYMGSKLILAQVCSCVEFWDVYKRVGNRPKSEDPGYLVEYPDGYLSWSPKRTFETAYRLVTDEEKGLI